MPIHKLPICTAPFSEADDCLLQLYRFYMAVLSISNIEQNPPSFKTSIVDFNKKLEETGVTVSAFKTSIVDFNEKLEETEVTVSAFKTSIVDFNA